MELIVGGLALGAAARAELRAERLRRRGRLRRRAIGDVRHRRCVLGLESGAVVAAAVAADVLLPLIWTAAFPNLARAWHRRNRLHLPQTATDAARGEKK